MRCDSCYCFEDNDPDVEECMSTVKYPATCLLDVDVAVIRGSRPYAHVVLMRLWAVMRKAFYALLLCTILTFRFSL